MVFLILLHFLLFCISTLPPLPYFLSPSSLFPPFISLVPRPHPLMRKNGLVNQVEILRLEILKLSGCFCNSVTYQHSKHSRFFHLIFTFQFNCMIYSNSYKGQNVGSQWSLLEGFHCSSNMLSNAFDCLIYGTCSSKEKMSYMYTSTSSVDLGYIDFILIPWPTLKRYVGS